MSVVESNIWNCGTFQNRTQRTHRIYTYIYVRKEWKKRIKHKIERCAHVTIIGISTGDREKWQQYVPIYFNIKLFANFYYK